MTAFVEFISTPTAFPGTTQALFLGEMRRNSAAKHVLVVAKAASNAGTVNFIVVVTIGESLIVELQVVGSGSYM